MGKVVVIYSSKYGYTKKYAQWIAEELKGDIFELDNAGQKDLSAYDTIILGSGLYAGRIRGIDFLVKNYEKIKTRKLVIFTCGLADYTKFENINNIYKRLVKVIPAYIMENVKIFYLQGGINYGKLSTKHKIMMGMLKKMITRKGSENLSEENREFLATYGQTLDFSDKSKIRDIIDYCVSG